MPAAWSALHARSRAEARFWNATTFPAPQADQGDESDQRRGDGRFEHTHCTLNAERERGLRQVADVKNGRAAGPARLAAGPGAGLDGMG